MFDINIGLDRLRGPSIFAQCAVLAAIAGAPAAAQPVSELLAPNIARFHASEEAKAERKPSMALERPRQGIGPVPASFETIPAFSMEDGLFVTRIDIDAGTSLYGTGQAAGPLQRNGRITETWNFDAYGYQDDLKNLYTSHPWVLAVREDGSAFGVLADSTWRVEMDLTDGITFRSHGPAHPAIVIEGETPQDVMIGLADLTGTITMPPKWAVGYHQCRYSYFPDDRVMEVAQEFRDRNLPADVIWMDIDYMDGFRCFTFDEELFPDPKQLNNWLDRRGFQNVWMIDPGLKNEDGYFAHDEGDAIDAWVKKADGTEFTGYVWPGECVFPDYTNAKVREWWAGLYEDFMSYDIDGVWNDMNEPAVFNVESKTMPEDNWHRADPEFGGPGTHAQFHNVYGMLMVKATREGVMKTNPNKRPFVLSRANYMGGHRYGATWTGDNTANWYHVDVSIPMMLNLSLSAQPFVGPDIGGFAGNGDGPMFARWMGFGTLMPFARGHTAKGNIDKEPWAFGPEVEATSRRALERRYRLLPLFYTLFEESSRNGMPVARPLFFHDPIDPAIRTEDDSFLLGENLLVAAYVTPDRERVHILPKNDGGMPWRAFDFPDFDGEGRDSDDPDQALLYARPGGIIPSGPVIQYVADRPNQYDELTLIIYADHNGVASGELYEDAGEGWAYKDGEYLRSKYTATTSDGVMTVKTETLSGSMPRPDRRLVARVLMPDGSEVIARGVDGQNLTVDLN